MKKAQGLSMNTIIIAAIAILVLIMIALIFTGRIKLFREGVEKCQNQGGRCMSEAECTGDGYGLVKEWDGCTDVCCLRIGEANTAADCAGSGGSCELEADCTGSVRTDLAGCSIPGRPCCLP